jgi:hypothetical protein
MGSNRKDAHYTYELIELEGVPMTQVAVAFLSVLLADVVLPCAGSVSDTPQELVRAAEVVATVTALADPDAFRVTRVWKGTPPPVLREPRDPRPCTGEPGVEPGGTYVAVVVDGTMRILDDVSTPGLTAYLEAPERVSTNDLVRMLRGWTRGTITDRAMSRWLRRVARVAEVDDWLDVDGEPVSVVLGVIRELDTRMHDDDGALRDACTRGVLRERLAPVAIRHLTSTARTGEELEALDAFPDELELEGELCPG